MKSSERDKAYYNINPLIYLRILRKQPTDRQGDERTDSERLVIGIHIRIRYPQ